MPQLQAAEVGYSIVVGEERVTELSKSKADGFPDSSARKLVFALNVVEVGFIALFFHWWGWWALLIAAYDFASIIRHSIEDEIKARGRQ